MALPNTGGGYQLGDGNLLEVTFFDQPAPPVATATATLTTAQITGGILLGSPGATAATYTMPSASDLDALLVNAKINSAFDFSVINIDGSGSGLITLAAGTGWTLVGFASISVATAVTSSSSWRARKTGTGTWTLYRLN